MTDPAPVRYPGYDVLSKRDGPSWNDATRRALDARLGLPSEPRFFTPTEWRTLGAVCDRIMPQAGNKQPVDLAAQVDDKMASNRTDGYRYPGMPRQDEAWRRGLAALEEAAQKDQGKPFHALDDASKDSMLLSMQDGRFGAEALGDMPPKTFFASRVVADIVNAYYAHPTGWNEIGWGGPASPRGYVRLQNGMRDPWEPVEAAEMGAEGAERRNRHVR